MGTGESQGVGVCEEGQQEALDLPLTWVGEVPGPAQNTCIPLLPGASSGLGLGRAAPNSHRLGMRVLAPFIRHTRGCQDGLPGAQSTVGVARVGIWARVAHSAFPQCHPGPSPPETAMIQRKPELPIPPESEPRARGSRFKGLHFVFGCWVIKRDRRRAGLQTDSPPPPVPGRSHTPGSPLTPGSGQEARLTTDHCSWPQRSRAQPRPGVGGRAPTFSELKVVK